MQLQKDIGRTNIIRLLPFPYKETKINEDVQNIANEYLHIIPTRKKSKIAFFGHLIRRNNLHRLILEGHWNGK